MNCKIFYSWQTDLPNSTNRGFIQSALEAAVKAIRDDESIKIEPVVDRDTVGVPGSPDIAETIFSKIDNSQIFVADVSIINNDKDGRKSPNPNVLVELGYAMKTLGLGKIIIVMNTDYGTPELLPFDLRTRRVVTYNVKKDETEKSTERKKLASIFEEAVRAILNDLESNTKQKPDISLLEKTIETISSSNPSQVISIRNYIKSLIEKIDAVAPLFPGTDEKTPPDDILVNALSDTHEYVFEFSRVAEIIAVMNSQEAATALIKMFEVVINNYEPPLGFSGSYTRTRHDFYKFLGHELYVTFVSYLIRENRWGLLERILDEGYFVRSPYRNSETVLFNRISDYVETLYQRNSRLKTNRLSIHADIINERHSQGLLSEICPMDQFVSADFFLYIREGFEWRPWSALYLYQYTPRFLTDLSRKKFAEQLLSTLHVSDVDALKELIAKRISELHELYGRRGFWRMGFNYTELINAIASK